MPSYTYTGTVTEGGETLHRYHAGANLTRATPLFSAPPRATATILVTGDGVIRSFRLAYTGPVTIDEDGEERTVTAAHVFELTYSDVGTTTVPRPDWVDRAANGSEPRTTETATG